jgi:hypothetical protein
MHRVDHDFVYSDAITIFSSYHFGKKFRKFIHNETFDFHRKKYLCVCETQRRTKTRKHAHQHSSKSQKMYVKQTCETYCIQWTVPPSVSAVITHFVVRNDKHMSCIWSWNQHQHYGWLNCLPVRECLHKLVSLMSLQRWNTSILKLFLCVLTLVRCVLDFSTDTFSSAIS